MNKHLYDCFNHWYHEGRGTIWFYSDPHFNDPEANMLRKDYIGDDEQVKHINSKVGKYDTLVILGDIGDENYVRKLRGYKVLIMGNHDKGASKYKRIVDHYYFKMSEYTKEDVLKMVNVPKGWKLTIKKMSIEEDCGLWCVDVDNGLFDEVYEGALLVAPNIILSHEPVDYPFARNIHGHTHGKWDAFNMCAEFINYTPVQISRFIKWGFTDIPDMHRTAIDSAIECKLKKK